MDERKYRIYECKHFCWTYWRHYGMKMPEGGCKLKNKELGSCRGICEKFEYRGDIDEKRNGIPKPVGGA